MKNLVLKTIAITLASIVSLITVVFGALCLFTPKTVAEILENLGSESASVFFYEQHYQKSEDIDTLALLIDKAYFSEDLIKQEEYLTLLTAHSDFDSFCALEDSKNQGSNFLAKEFYLDTFVNVLIKNQKFDKALGIAVEYVNKNGYTLNNPLSAILNTSFDCLSLEQKQSLKLAIENAPCLDGTNQQTYKINDLNKFN